MLLSSSYNALAKGKKIGSESHRLPVLVAAVTPPCTQPQAALGPAEAVQSRASEAIAV